jgi:hypothetical protein
MGFDTIRASAETIINGWGSIPVAFDNVAFDTTAHDSWARITVLDGDSFNNALGGNCLRRTGIITIQVFTPQWSGSATGRAYAEELSGLFTNTVDGNVIYGVAALTRVGHDQDIYQLNVSIPFTFDEVL